MTHEQDWVFYRLVPELIARGLILNAEDSDGFVGDAEIGQEILDIAAEDGVLINADGYCKSCSAEDASPPDVYVIPQDGTYRVSSTEPPQLVEEWGAPCQRRGCEHYRSGHMLGPCDWCSCGRFLWPGHDDEAEERLSEQLQQCTD